MREVSILPEPPVQQRDGRWTVVQRKEAWEALGPRVFDEHLDRLRKVVVEVLRERDPKFDLPPDDRFAASVYGKVLSHSPILRKGMSESLALLGSYPQALTSCSTGKAEITAQLAVREILSNADWVFWASLNDLLPLMAEASPAEFLDVVERTLSRNPCPFDDVFAQEGSGPMGGNYMTGLLWALETLAWDAEYLIRVVVVLGELAARDPGGSWANRPANSLSTILLPWLPQTCAPIPKRLVAVKTLLGEVPDIAWNLLLTLLPNSHQMSSGSRKPEWRIMIAQDWSEKVTHSEYWEQVSAYAELAVDMAIQDSSKLAALIGRLDDLSSPAYDHLLAHLNSNAIVSQPQADRLRLWTALVALVSEHRKFADAKWAMKPEDVDTLEKVSERLAPDDPFVRHQYLFGDRDFDLLGESDDYDGQQKALEERRQKAVSEIFKDGGVEAVLKFAQAVKQPWYVGFAFGTAETSDVEEGILPALLETENQSLERFVGGVVLGRFRSRGWRWVDEVDTSLWLPSQKGQFLAYLPFTPETWAHSTLLLGEDESPYWTKTNANPYAAEEGLELAIDPLVKYGRPHAALRCISRLLHKRRPLNCQQATRVLLSTLESKEDTREIEAHDIVDVIKALQRDPNTSPDELFQVEWAFLPLLDRHRGAAPKLLEQRLADDPAFFCQVIRIVYRSKKEEHPAEEPTEQQKNIATNAYRLFETWKTPPGTQKDGTFMGDTLTEWLNTVRFACTESGHLEIALLKVGQVLIHTPPDPDGLWIHRSAAEALNAKDAKSMRDGYHTALFNARGGHWVDPEGRPEQELALKYRTRAEEVEARGYHRLATTLRDLAVTYEHHAERLRSRGLFDELDS